MTYLARVAFFVSFLPALALGQNTAAPADARAEGVNVYLDCRSCDNAYIRTEITYVNYVRDRIQADVHILVTRQRTGSDGREFTLTFIGQNRFPGVNDTLLYVSAQTDTEDDRRKGMVEALKNGLFRYVLHTPQGAFLSSQYSRQEPPDEIDDPWNYWVYRANANAFTNGEASKREFSGRLGFSANRTTEEWKIRLEVDTDYDQEEDEYDDNGVTVKESFVRRNHEFESLIVRSLSDHWSVGGTFDVFTSTYSNLDVSTILAPAIEYNYFPYSESTRHQLTARYRVGVVANRYVDSTIYAKIEEALPAHELRLELDLRQPWGSTSLSINSSQYLHDISKYNVRLSGNINVRIYEGLSFNIRGSYSQIRDQIALPAGGASQSEVLTRQREIATNYNYFTAFGISYSFGSIYNNVVNARM
jgi:hypothetical protein